MKRRVAAVLGANAAGRTLIDYLAGRFSYRTAEEWRERIAAGEIRLDGTCRSPETVLVSGMHLAYEPADLVEPPVRTDYTIRYADADLLVIDKPGNLPVHPAGPYFEHTLWALLHERYPTLHFINRLDRETSGLLLAALHPESARQLCRRLPEMVKIYRVIVHGAFAEAIDAIGGLEPDETSIVRKKRKFVPGENAAGEFAHTEFNPVRIAGDLSLVEARLHTGRFHQIRATLATLGFPVAGDKLYGLDETIYLRLRGDRLTAADREKLRIDRQALHCAHLEFHHPRDGRKLAFDSPLPAELETLLEK